MSDITFGLSGGPRGGWGPRQTRTKGRRRQVRAGSSAHQDAGLSLS